MTIRRMKSYTGEQGYVYQYYFVGKRRALASVPEAPASEYEFDVTSDRKTTDSESDFLRDEAQSAWASEHGRPLNEAEQYGAVKMRLFRAFDEIGNMMGDGRRLVVDAGNLEELLAGLGVD